MAVQCKCDWKQLMNALNNNTVATDIKTILINLKLDTSAIAPCILQTWYKHASRFHGSVIIRYEKHIRMLEDIGIRGKEVYREILRDCPTDANLCHIDNLIKSGPGLNISGRMVDFFVTQIPKYINMSYLLDVTDQPAQIVQSRIPGRNVVLFDLGNSYRQKMQQYSKSYFDCFARGSRICHVLTSGEILQISLCQYQFFIWADRFRVFEYLQQIKPQLDEIHKKLRLSAVGKGIPPKRIKRTRLLGAIRAPERLHDPKKRKRK